MFINSQKLSQISSSRRLFELTSSIRHRLSPLKGSNAMTIDQRFFINEILDSLIDKHSFLLQSRLQAIIKRTEKNYCNATIYDYIVEALCDSEFFKKDTFLTEKEFIISNIKISISFHKEINLIIPIFSRKPLSPIKNNGVNPDLGEINSLLRFYSLTKLITNLSEVQCNFIILSDGHKYKMACLTPKYIVDNYQRALLYWIRELSLSDYVKFFDYEEWIQKDKDHNWLNIREELYKSKYKELSIKYDKLFSLDNIGPMVGKHIDSEFEQLKYTFSSILASVNYIDLYGNDLLSIYFDQDIINFYISFILSLEMDLKDINNSYMFSNHLVGELSTRANDLIYIMRKSAWEEAKRYVSISLTDRKLDTLYLEDNRFIKCTIHKKQREFNFITTSRGDYSRTAQHSVGGLTKDFNVNYRYRIEREDLNEQAVYLKYNSQDANDNPLNLISLNKQPIYYIS